MIESIDILGSLGTVILTAPVTDSSERNHTLQQENNIRLVWNASTMTALPAGSYIVYNGERYYLLRDYTPQKKSATRYSYDVKFGAVDELLATFLFYRIVSVTDEQQQTSVWNEPEFSINANLKTIADIVIERLNALDLGITFSIPALNQGDTSHEYENTELKPLVFDGINIAEALSYIANEFETEWWIENTESYGNKILHFDKCEYGSFQEVSDNYTKDSKGEWHSGGLSSVAQESNENAVTRKIYIFGSERNIVRKNVIQNGMSISYNKKLRLPNTQTETIVINGNQYQIRAYNEESVIMVSGPGVIKGESIQMFDDIYPKMDMTVNRVEKVVNSDGSEIFYIKGDKLTSDFMESESYDPAIYDGKINPGKQGLLLEGCTLMITFTSGLLNGREFECAWYPSTNTLGIKPESDDDIQIPQGELKPNDGDTFILWNLAMPEQQVQDAQTELYNKAKEYIEEALTTIPDTKCVTEAVYTKSNGLRYDVGTKVKVTSDVFIGGVLYSRITSIRYSLTKENNIEFTLSSARATGRLAGIENAIAEITEMSDMTKQRQVSISRRQWHDVDELMNMLDNIKTEMSVVGSEHSSFVFSSQINYSNQTNILSITKGFIQHTVFINNDMKGEWRMSGDWSADFSQGNTILNPDGTSVTTDENTAYYVYFYCNKSSDSVGVHISTSQIDDTSRGHYFFLAGILSSVFENNRVFNRASGLTITVGGTITTEVVQDQNRQLIIDFASNPPRIIARNGATIEGAIKFTMPDGKPASIGGENIAKNSYKYRNGIGSAFGWIAERDDHYKMSDMSVHLMPGRTYIITCMSDGLWRGVNTPVSPLNADHVEIFLFLNGSYDDEHLSMLNTGTKQILADGRLAWLFTVPDTYAEGDYFVRFDINKRGCEHYLWDFQCVANSNVTTEWRKSELDPDLGALDISFLQEYSAGSEGNSQRLTERLNSGDVIVFTCDTVAGNAYLALNTGGEFSKRIGISPDEPIYYTVPDDGNTYYLSIYNGSSTSCSVQGIIIRKYKDYKDWSIQYLKDALGASTDIQGGLVSTSVVQVRNANGDVKGGISGLSGDNIGFWMGGTYQQALNNLVNVILRKDGTARIGNFEVFSDHIRVSLQNSGYAKIDATGITICDQNDKEKVKLVDSVIGMDSFEETHVYEYSFANVDVPTVTQGQKNATLGETKSIAYSPNSIVVSGNFYILLFPVSGDRITGTISLRMVDEYTGEDYDLLNRQSLFYEATKNGSSYNIYVDGVFQSGGFYLEAINKTFTNLQRGHKFRIECGLSIDAGVTGSIRIAGQTSNKIKVKLSEKEIKAERTLIGLNGLISYQNENQYFGAFRDTQNKYNIVGRADVLNLTQN